MMVLLVESRLDYSKSDSDQPSFHSRQLKATQFVKVSEKLTERNTQQLVKLIRVFGDKLDFDHFAKFAVKN